MELVTKKRLHLVSGRANLPLAEEIAERLGVTLGDANLGQFANGELHTRFGESVRGTDVFIIQTHAGTDGMSVNDAIMEQLIMVDAAKRASAKRITAVAPFYGYARQDRKSEGREPITAKLVANMFKAAGAKRLISVDLHSGQIQGFFDGPVDHLTAMPVLVDYMAGLGEDLVVVSPDAGRVKVAERYANQLHADLAIVHKRRVKGVKNTVEARDVVGEVDGRVCVLIDDMIDTGGTIVAAAEQLKARGAVGDLRRLHPRRVLGPGHRPAQELGDLQGRHHQHAAAAAREAARQDRGPLGRRHHRRRHRRRLRGHVGQRDLRRRTTSPEGRRPPSGARARRRRGPPTVPVVACPGGATGWIGCRPGPRPGVAQWPCFIDQRPTAMVPPRNRPLQMPHHTAMTVTAPADHSGARAFTISHMAAVKSRIPTTEPMTMALP